MRRRGLSLLEVVLALAVLGLGLLPMMDLVGAARATFGQGRELLRLQSRAVEAVTRARARLVRGELRGLGPEAEHREVQEAEGMRTETVVRSIPRRGLFDVHVRVTGEDRFFELTQLVAAPGGSYLTPVPGGSP